MSYKIGSKLDRPDIIIVGTPPLIVPLTGILLGKKHKAFTILEIRDLFPETAVVLGKLNSKFLHFIWEKWENFLRSRFDHIIAVVPQIRQHLIKKGFSKDKITTIINGYDVEHLGYNRLDSDIEKFFQKYQIKFIIVYGGGMGWGINLQTVLEAAKLCHSNEKLIYAFFGEGELKTQYIRYAQKNGLKNVFFFSPQPRLAINEIFRRANALVHSFIDNDFFKCALPNKIFEYHGSGNPIIFGGKGDTAELIKNARSGIVVEPGNPKQMAEAFLWLSSDPKKAKAMGKYGKEYIMKYYRREIVFQKWDHLLKMIESLKN